MNQLTRQTRRDGIDPELIRARVQAEFVGAEYPGNGQMLGKRALKFVEVSNVIDTFLFHGDSVSDQP